MKLKSVKRIRAIFGIITGLVIMGASFQNCSKVAGNLDDSSVITNCSPSKVSLEIFVNGVIYSTQDGPLTFSENQNIVFGAGYQKAPTCLPTESDHWEMPDGLIIYNDCATVTNARPGSYKIYWVVPPLPCEGPSAKTFSKIISFIVR